MIKLIQKPNGEFFISSEWLEDWKNSKEEGPNANAKLICSHDKFAITKNKKLIITELWDYIRDNYPESRVFIKTEEECPECKDEQEGKEEQAKQLQEDVSVIKSEFYSALTMYVNPFKNSPGKYHLIPRQWVTQWRATIDRGEVPSAPLDNSLVDKDSGYVHYNPETEKFFYGVREDIWQALRDRYGPPELIPIVLTVTGKDKYTLDPEYSEEVAELRRQNEIKDTITIVTKNATPAQKKNNNFKPFKLTAPPDTNMEILKLQIFQNTSLDPLYQQLVYNDVKLTENHKTLEEYSICGGSTIFLYILDENSVEIDYSSVVYDNIHEVELGFKGSYLHGTDNEEHHHNNEETQKQYSETDPYQDWPCSTCTYMNSYEDPTCQVCGASRPPIVLL